MKKQNLFSMLAIVAWFTFLGISCTTTENNGATDNALTTTSGEEAQVASWSDVVINTADANINNIAANLYTTPSTVTGSNTSVLTITVDKPDTTSFPKIITFDFGTTGFIDARNDTIKGKMIVTISNKLWMSGSTKTIKLVGFYVNSNNIKGIKVITNNGLNTSNQPSMKDVASDTIIRNDGTRITRQSTRIRTRIDDNGTPQNFGDDKFSITGTCAGKNAQGVIYIVRISNPLIVYNDYNFIVQGTIITTTQSRSASLDYGDGTKDNIATLTIDGKITNITLKN
jgi:hypothetical protein